MIKKRNWFLLLLVCAAALTLFCSCTDTAAEGKRETVTIACWNDQLGEQYAKYLQPIFPDVNFIFYTATNSPDFYHFKESLGDLPDILTVRRFSLNDVSGWRDALMDLSGCALTNTFHQSYLRSYTYSDGTVNWLPACAEVDSIIINRVLLEENGLRLPTNYPEFIDVCMALRALGIRPFLTNFTADFSCMELLQGLSIPQLVSQEGREWRQLYESGQTNQLSEPVWLPVFERLQEFLAAAGITASDLETEHSQILGAYQDNRLAMMRGTGNEMTIRNSVNGESMLMPYFGQTEEDNWYLTYPAFHIAASAAAEQTPERKQLILDIMTAMLSEEGLQQIASGKNMIPYTKGTVLPLSESLRHIQPYIDSNRLYIRLASADMFDVSTQIVRGMITGEYPDARSAFDAFNAAMLAEQDTMPTVVKIDPGYPYAFHPEHGSQAASAVMNSLREELGTQLLIGQSTHVSGNIAAGVYTEEQLRYLMAGSEADALQCSLTGEQLYKYIENLLTQSETLGTVYGDSSLYVSSGFEMELHKTDSGYTLVRLTMDGKALDRSAVYSATMLGYEPVQRALLDACGVSGCQRLEQNPNQLLTVRLLSGVPLAAPTDYITLQ